MVSSQLRLLAQRLNARPRGRDAVVAVIYLLLGLALLQFGGYHLWGAAGMVDPTGLWSTGTAFLLLLIAMSALAAARSTHPFLVLGAGTPLAVADLVLGSSLGVIILFADFVYCAFRYGSDRGVRILLVAILALGVAIGITLVVWPSAGARFAMIALQWALIVLIAALWGWNVRSERQRTRLAMAEEHARSTQRLRQRIAHDLHDLVANQIAVAGLNIEAARLRIAQMTEASDEVDDSLAQATRGAEEAHGQLRRLIAVLTTVEDLGETSVQTPDAGGLDGLLPAGRTLVRRGTELDEVLVRMPPQSAGIVMRAIQELITNALKHGTGDVVLTVTDAGATTVQVSNRVAPGAARVPGTGIGIIGATLLLNGVGASIESAATDEDHWNAALTIPEGTHV